MGLWDKIKQAKNFVTGCGADVSIAFESTTIALGEPLKMKVIVAVKDAALNMDKAYIKVRSREIVKVTDRDYNNGRTTRENIKKKVNTWEQETPIAPAQELEANKSYEWDAEISIPDGNYPTYRGRNAWHEYEVFAGLDVPGNDPDSGWQPFTVK